MYPAVRDCKTDLHHVANLGRPECASRRARRCDIGATRGRLGRPPPAERERTIRVNTRVRLGLAWVTLRSSDRLRFCH